VHVGACACTGMVKGKMTRHGTAQALRKGRAKEGGVASVPLPAMEWDAFTGR